MKSDIAATFLFDADACQLNHASFGAPTAALMDRVDAHRRELERNTAHNLSGGLLERLATSQQALAARLDCKERNLALTANTTSGSAALIASAVRRGITKVVLLSLEYSTVIRAWQAAAETFEFEVQLVDVPLPVASAEDLISALDSQVVGVFDVLVCSWITSSTSLVLPVAALATWARSRNARTYVDAAHVAGHLGVSIEQANADAVFGTLHKWLPVPRPAGFLWVGDDLVDDIRPAEVSHPWSAESLLERFSWRGTWDPASLFAIPDAFEQLDVWDAAGLLPESRRLAASITDQLVGLGLQPTGPAEMLPPRMRAFLMPHAGIEELTRHMADRDIRPWLGTAADGTSILRFATHVYNDESDADRLVAAVRELG